jgi:uncharacterized membrane protein YtjA (UPF0391 family)
VIKRKKKNMTAHKQFSACWAIIFFVITIISGAVGYVLVDGVSGMARSASYIFAGLFIVSLLGRLRRPGSRGAW